MHDLDVVGGLQRACNLRCDVDGSARIQSPVGLQDAGQRLAAQQLHHLIAGAFGRDAAVKDLDDVLVLRAAGGRGFI